MMKSYQSMKYWLLNLLAINSMFRHFFLMKYILNFFAGILLTGCHTISMITKPQHSHCLKPPAWIVDGALNGARDLLRFLTVTRPMKAGQLRISGWRVTACAYAAA